MTKLLFSCVLMLAAIGFTAACGGDDDGDDSGAASPTASASEASSESPTETADEPIDTGTPSPTPGELGQLSSAREILQQLSEPLPTGPEWRIDYDETALDSGVFNIVSIAPGSFDAWAEDMREGQQWFRDRGLDPCSPPLQTLVGYSADQAWPPSGATPQTFQPCG